MTFQSVGDFVRKEHSFETRTGPAGRPGPETGPGLSKNPLRSWPGETRSTHLIDPGKPG
jgi:hypothetical protein